MPQPKKTQTKPSAARRSDRPSSAPRGSASAAGYHYLDLFNNCQRKFYFRHVLRLAPLHLSYPLLFGTIFHIGKEVYYTNKGSLAQATRAMLTALRLRKSLFEDPKNYQDAAYRLPALFEAWHYETGQDDFHLYNILAVERSVSVVISKDPRIVLTARLDLIVSPKASKRLYVLDTKTSQSSHYITKEAFHFSDQRTTYQLAAQRLYPKLQFGGISADISHWNKNNNNPSAIINYRGDWETRTEPYIEQYRQGVASTFIEITQKVQALKTTSEFALFPRNRHYCMAYSHHCEYADICDLALHARSKVPHGFIREEQAAKLTDEVVDLL